MARVIFFFWKLPTPWKSNGASLKMPPFQEAHHQIIWLYVKIHFEFSIIDLKSQVARGNNSIGWFDILLNNIQAVLIFDPHYNLMGSFSNIHISKCSRGGEMGHSNTSVVHIIAWSCRSFQNIRQSRFFPFRKNTTWTSTILPPEVTPKQAFLEDMFGRVWKMTLNTP